MAEASRERAPRSVALAAIGAGAVAGVGLGAWLLWRRHGAGSAISESSEQAHAIVQIGAFAIPLAIGLGPAGARWARGLVVASLAGLAGGGVWLAAGLALPGVVFDPAWHLGLFGVALPLVLRRMDAPLGGRLAWPYGVGVAVAAVGLAWPGAATGAWLVQSGRGLFALALVPLPFLRSARVRSAVWWISAASIATVANAVHEIAGGPPGAYFVSDAVRHVFTIGGLLLGLLVLAAPRARVPIAVLASLATALRFGVYPIAYGPGSLAGAGRALAVASGVLGLAAVGVALVANLERRGGRAS